MASGAGTVTVNIVGNAAQLDRTLEHVGRSLDKNLGTMGAKFKSAGRAMTMGLTLPIVGGMGLAVKAFGDFEQQLNTFEAVSGATGKQMAQIGKLAKDLGKDITLPGTSAKDAADAMTELAKAGLSVNDTMDASKAVLQLSAAAQIGNAEAATLTATALNAFGLEGGKAIKVADLLAATANASSAEITDVGLAMSQAAAVWAAAKIPVEDLSTAIGLMANNGIRGSDAGTSLKTALLSLQTPSNKQTNVMRELGFAIYDAHGKMKPFRDIVGNLQTSMRGLTQEQRESSLGIIFGSDAIRAGNILLKEGVKGWDAMKVAVTEEGAAAAVAGAKMKGVTGAIEALKSNIETLMITVGEKLAPILTDWAMKLNGLVDWFGRLSPGVQNMVLLTLAFVAALGPLIYVIGTLLTVIRALQVALLFLAANPIVLIIAGIAALAAGIVYAYHRFEAFRNVVDGVFTWIKNNWPLLVGVLLGPFGIATAAIITNFETIKRAFKAAMNWVIDVWNRFEFKIGGQEVFGVNMPGVTIGTPDVPRFHSGGVVPGAPGSETLGLLQAGERVLPRGAAGGGTTVIQLILDGREVAEVVHINLLEKQRRSGALGLT